MYKSMQKSQTHVILIVIFLGTPLLIVVIGLAARHEYYGVYGKDGELA